MTVFACRVLFLVAAALTAFAASGETQRTLVLAARPQLLLHTEMHVSRIRQVSADAQGRYLLTVSEDKTARIWELQAREARRTWVAPVAPGDEGKLFAAALSPDGKTAAVGGWTSDGAKGYAVHFFDRTSGSVVRRVGGFPNVIHQLAWSPDGRWVAVATGGGGVHLVRASDGALAGSDSDYADSASGLDFAAQGRLAAVADDGGVRLYSVGEGGLKLAARKRSAAGNRPTGVRFSPSGDELAVVYEDSGAVEIFGGAALEPRRLVARPWSPGLTRIAWSRDGRRLFAAGRVAEGGHAVLVSWADRGAGAMQTMPTPAENSILDLVMLEDGRLVVASADPLWAALARDGRWQISRSDAIDFRQRMRSGLHASANGQRVFIAQGQANQSFVSFGFDDKMLSNASALPAAAVRFATGLAGARLARGERADRLQHGQAEYALEMHEQPRVLLPSEEGALVGSEWFLRAFDRRGAVKWKTALSATAWALAAVDSGKIVIAALGDGTLRWYSSQTGQELAALFIKAGSPRWVAWNPAGYYDSSPGGEDLIGWVVSRGQLADYFPVSRFRQDFFRPQQVQPAQGLSAQADAGPKQTPPVVEILDPEDGSTTKSQSALIALRVHAGSADKIERLRIRSNGRLARQLEASELSAARVAGGEPGRYRVEVRLDPGDNQVEIFAESSAGTSKAASLKLVAAAKPAAPQPFDAKPKLYVLAVGVSAYRDNSLTLNFAAKDAKDFAATIGAQKGKLYRDVEIKILDDARATRDAVLDGLEWLRREVTARDLGMLFIAGHGVNDSDGVYYYLPVDVDPNSLKRTGVIFSEIRNTMVNLAGKALFFIDTCHSGNVLGAGRRAVPRDITAVINDLSSAENGVVVFSSSTGRQYSLEAPAWGNGAFTKALVEGLQGNADLSRNGTITHKMLDFFVSERVKTLTQGKQTPVTQAPGGVPDFPIALR